MSAVNFDLVAPVYDFLAKLVFGKSIKKSQTVFLDQIPRGAKVLIIGGGTGWIIKEIYKKATPSKIVYVEASEKMLYLAKGKNKKGVIEWVLGTEKEIPDISFDVIITCYFLDVFANEALPALTAQLKAHLKKEGVWIFADFVRETWLVKAAYFFFRLTARLKNQHLPDYDLAMKALVLRQERRYYYNMIAARLYFNS